MAQYLICPRISAIAVRHFRSSIETSVPISTVRANLPASAQGDVPNVFAKENVRVWGFRNSTRDYFDRVNVGDIVLFYVREKGVVGLNYACLVLGKNVQGEALSLELWQSTDFPNIVFLGEPIQSFIPLEEFNALMQARERLAIGSAYQNADDAIFTDEIGRRITPMAASCACERIARKAKISTTRLHDLRHTAATTLLLAGVDVRTTAGILGHAAPTITLSTYAHLMPEAQRDAVERLGERLERLAGTTV